MNKRIIILLLFIIALLTTYSVQTSMNTSTEKNKHGNYTNNSSSIVKLIHKINSSREK